MPIQIREHLLATLKSTVDEEYDRYGFVAEFRGIGQSLLDGRTPVLSIIDDETCRHIHMQGTQPVGFTARPHGFEVDGTVQRCRYGRKYVTLLVF
jgi:hypothetical protein